MHTGTLHCYFSGKDLHQGSYKVSVTPLNGRFYLEPDPSYRHTFPSTGSSYTTQTLSFTGEDDLAFRFSILFTNAIDPSRNGEVYSSTVKVSSRNVLSFTIQERPDDKELGFQTTISSTLSSQNLVLDIRPGSLDLE